MTLRCRGCRRDLPAAAFREGRSTRSLCAACRNARRRARLAADPAALAAKRAADRAYRARQRAQPDAAAAKRAADRALYAQRRLATGKAYRPRVRAPDPEYRRPLPPGPFAAWLAAAAAREGSLQAAAARARIGAPRARAVQGGQAPALDTVDRAIQNYGPLVVAGRTVCRLTDLYPALEP